MLSFSLGKNIIDFYLVVYIYNKIEKDKGSCLKKKKNSLISFSPHRRDGIKRYCTSTRRS
jgi:hypothetical protein